MSRKEELVEEITKAVALLSRLEAEQAQARTRLAALQAELASLGEAGLAGAVAAGFGLDAEEVGELRAEPWTRRPSGRPHVLRMTEPLPERVRAVLSQRLFIEKAGLPSPMLNQIKPLGRCRGSPGR